MSVDVSFEVVDKLWFQPMQVPRLIKPAHATTTKMCPYCGSDVLGLIRSQNMKWCADCNKWFDWFLDDGQRPLL